MNDRKIGVALLSSAVLLMGVFSCSLNKIQYDEDDSASVQNEAVASAYFEDGADLSTTAVSSAPEASSGRRKLTIQDVRFQCADITLDVDDSSTLLHPKGKITADFGSGCADKRGSTRAGKIIISYYGRRFLPGSSISIALQDYSINGVAISGTYLITNNDSSAEDHPIFMIALTGGNLVWPNGKGATRNSYIRREWIRTTDGVNDEWFVSGAAIGTNRNMEEFAVQINQKLVYQKICEVAKAKFLPSSGTETLVVKGKKIELDFDTSACDQKVTIAINGKSTVADLTNVVE